MTDQVLNPDLLEVFANAHKEHSRCFAQEEDIDDYSLEALEEEIERRKHRIELSKSESKEKGRADWTTSYQTWSDWAAIEELQARAESLKSRTPKEKKHTGQLANELKVHFVKLVGVCSHDHSAEREVFQKPFTEKIKECHEFREEGNAWFKEGQYFRASERYRKVLTWLDYTFAKTDEQQQQIDEIHLPSLLNLAICQLRLRQYKGALNYCRRALKLDPENLKALFCSAKAYRFLDNFEDSEAFINKAYKLMPSNVEICCEKALLRNKMRRYKLDSKLRATAMFKGNTSPNMANERVYAENPKPIDHAPDLLKSDSKDAPSYTAFTDYEFAYTEETESKD